MSTDSLAEIRPLADSRFIKSTEYMERARRLIPRGVTSAKRAGLRPTPLVIESAKGSHVTDIDGNVYIDYVAAYGPTLLGHNFEPVQTAVLEQMGKGTLYGAQHPLEADLAELVIRAVPSAERVLFNVTGSEAAHAALRLARAATGRKLILRFVGHYHGWIDPIPPSTLSDGTTPTHAPSVAPDYAFTSDDILICPWNDVEAIEDVMTRFGDEVAAVILEPVAANNRCLAPDSGYLEKVRELCDKHGALLIFDEVITGFRVALGGAQERFGVRPDLTVLAKAIAAGYPLSAVAGRADILSLAENRLDWAGTYNGNALAMAAGVAALGYLTENRDSVYNQLEQRSSALVDGINEAAAEADLPLAAANVGSIVRLYWGVPAPRNRLENVLQGDLQALADFSEDLLRLGIHCREHGQWFVSTAHTQEDIDNTVAAVRVALQGWKR